MPLDDDIRVLSAVGLFQDLSGEQLRLLAFGAENMRLAAGRELYREGAPADCAFVVAAGEIDISETKGGRTVVTRTVGPGAILGEYALIAPVKRRTTATVRRNAELIRVNRTQFRRILEEYPALAHKLHARMSQELLALTSQVASLKRRFED